MPPSVTSSAITRPWIGLSGSQSPSAAPLVVHPDQRPAQLRVRRHRRAEQDSAVAVERSALVPQAVVPLPRRPRVGFDRPAEGIFPPVPLGLDRHGRLVVEQDSDPVGRSRVGLEAVHQPLLDEAVHGRQPAVEAVRGDVGGRLGGGPMLGEFLRVRFVVVGAAVGDEDQILEIECPGRQSRVPAMNGYAKRGFMMSVRPNARSVANVFRVVWPFTFQTVSISIRSAIAGHCPPSWMCRPSGSVMRGGTTRLTWGMSSHVQPSSARGASRSWS